MASRPTNKMTRALSFVTLAALAIPISATAATSAETPAQPDTEATWSTVEVVVEDYSLDGALIDVNTYEFEAEPGAEGSFTVPEPESEPQIVPFGSGNQNIPAPAAASGCRNVWTSVQEGTAYAWYTVKNNIYFCYNKSTKKVSNATVSFTTNNHDGLNNFNPYTADKKYYNYNGWGTNTGYLSQKTWKVIRDIGIGLVYYPRADIYAHGDGSAYASWTTS